MFVLGANETVNADLEQEAKIYKDIVQADFREGYYNLTYNTITALRWVTIYCPSAEYIIKGNLSSNFNRPVENLTLSLIAHNFPGDDDSWFNIDLVKTEVAINGDGPVILGKLFVKANRNKNQKSKWYTPTGVLAQLTYPTFVSGAG